MIVKEAFESGNQTSQNATLNYIVFECEDKSQAIEGVFATAPYFYSGLSYQDFSYEIVNETTHRVEMSYGVNSRSSEHQSTWQYATSGGTTRVKQSFSTIGNYAPEGETPPNFYGAIGVSKNGVEGVDVVSPSLSYKESHYRFLGQFTVGYAKLIGAMTGTVNSTPFRAWAPGEVLFAGATMEGQDYKGISLSYDFLISPNATNITIGEIVIAEKFGWDYLWCTYNTVLDSVTGCLVEKPRSAHIERVYPYTNFANLLI